MTAIRSDSGVDGGRLHRPCPKRIWIEGDSHHLGHRPGACWRTPPRDDGSAGRRHRRGLWTAERWTAALVDPGMAVPYDAGGEASFSEDGTVSGTEEYSEDGTVDEGDTSMERHAGRFPHGGPGAMMLELKNICKTYTQGKLDVPVLEGHLPLRGRGRVCGHHGALGLWQDHPDEYYRLFGQPHLGGVFPGGEGHCPEQRLQTVRCAPAQHRLCVPKLLPALPAERPGKCGFAPAVRWGAPQGAAGDCPQGVGAGGPGGPGEL